MADPEADPEPGDLELAVRADLDRWKLTGTSLGAAALDLAARLDRPKVSPTGAAMLHGQLNKALADLRKLAPPEDAGDEVTELQQEYEGLRVVGDQ